MPRKSRDILTQIVISAVLVPIIVFFIWYFLLGYFNPPKLIYVVDTSSNFCPTRIYFDSDWTSSFKYQYKNIGSSGRILSTMWSKELSIKNKNDNEFLRAVAQLWFVEKGVHQNFEYNILHNQSNTLSNFTLNTQTTCTYDVFSVNFNCNKMKYAYCSYEKEGYRRFKLVNEKRFEE